MPNDAKLGLLVGVIGVIVVAVVSAGQLPQPHPAANVPATVQKIAPPAPVERPVANLVADAKPTPAPVQAPEPRVVATVLPVNLSSTPVVRTKREPVATPTSRSKPDADLEP